MIPDSGHSTLPHPKAVSIISNVPLTLGNLKRSSCQRNSEICSNLAPFRFSQGTRRSKTSVFSRNTCRPLGVKKRVGRYFFSHFLDVISCCQPIHVVQNLFQMMLFWFQPVGHSLPGFPAYCNPPKWGDRRNLPNLPAPK